MAKVPRLTFDLILRTCAGTGVHTFVHVERGGGGEVQLLCFTFIHSFAMRT